MLFGYYVFNERCCAWYDLATNRYSRQSGRCVPSKSCGQCRTAAGRWCCVHVFVVRCSLVAHIFIIKIIIFVFGAEGQTAATERECVGGSATQQHRSPSTAERITKRKTEQNRKKKLNTHSLPVMKLSLHSLKIGSCSLFSHRASINHNRSQRALLWGRQHRNRRYTS